MKWLLQQKLKYIAKLVLLKYKPDIVGITGSVGKTSAKDAIFAVLSSKHKVRRNIKNYNNEIGLPLTIIGTESPGKSMLGWLRVFWQAFILIIKKDKNYPEILVLEMGIDRPGDMKYLLGITKANVGVLTLIGPVHLEFFGSVEKIAEEKAILIKNLKKNGWAVINYDDQKSKEVAEISKARVLSFGLNSGASVKAQELKFSFEKSKSADHLLGISFKLNYNEAFVPVLLPDVIGYNAIYASLAAAAVGIAYDMNLVDIANALRRFKSPPGRMNLIDGVKHTMIIDDSYNSSPQSAKSALDIFSKIKIGAKNKKFAVLGDMLELGSYSEAGHREVGEYAYQAGINKLIVVGERARDIGRGAEAAGMLRDNIFRFKDSKTAAKFLEDRIRQGDLILVKGSQGVRMEHVVKEIMTEPTRAKELLVRQGGLWLGT